MEKWKEKLYNSIVNGVVDYNLFIEIAYVIVEDLNLKDYVKNISMACLNFGVDGLYDRTNKKIIIERKDMQYILHLGGYYYYYLFEILFHEIEHAKQCKLCDECVPYLDELVRGHNYTLKEMKKIEKGCVLIESNKFSDNNKIRYALYHDFYPTEHEANYYAYLNTAKFLNDILKFDTILLPYTDKIYSCKLMQLLLKGYKTKLISSKLVSPIEKIIPKHIPDIHRRMLLDPEYLDDYDKLTLGLPIEYEKYLLCRDTLNKGEVPKDIKQFILNIK